MRRLPPFAELVAFEAVARHLSFTRAATELHLTQSAISHRVRRLEKFYGTPLIRRINPGIALTEAGAALLPELASLLDGLMRLGKSEERRLRVAAGTSLCTRWLAGRLAGFMARRPEVSIELIAIDNDNTPVPDVDVRILWVKDGDVAAGVPQASLGREHVFPVCSPSLLPQRRPTADAHVLDAMTLLHKSAQTAGEWSWAVWLERLGLDRKRRGGELRFTDLNLSIAAAIEGTGVSLARSLLAYDALREGRLVVPVTNLEPMVSVRHHLARWRREKADDPNINAFVEWLVSEARTTLMSTSRLIRKRPGLATPQRARLVRAL